MNRQAVGSGAPLTHTLTLVAVVLTASAAGGANVVSSPVGLVRLDLGPHERVLAANPFLPFDAGLPVVAPRDTNTTDTVRVMTWDAVRQAYATFHCPIGEALPPECEPADGETPALLPGEGFWIDNPTDRHLSAFLTGEVVPDDTVCLPVVGGLNLLGYPFSQGYPLNPETGLLGLAGDTPGDHVTTWEAGAYRFEPTNLAMGAGCFYERANTNAAWWTEARPYADPFPGEGAPRVAGMRVEADGALTLAIQSAGEPGERLEVFFKDAERADIFDPRSGWHVAGTPDGAGPSMQWRDEGLGAGVAVRYYLVARADLDADGDGVPDARELYVYGTSAHLVSGETEDGRASGLTEGIENSVADTNATPPGAEESTRAIPWRVGRVIYVDQRIGKDTLSGRLTAVVGADGPKATIGGGLKAVRPGDRIVIKSGRYGEHLNIAAKRTSVCIDGVVNLSGHPPTPGPCLPEAVSPPERTDTVDVAPGSTNVVPRNTTELCVPRQRAG